MAHSTSCNRNSSPRCSLFLGGIYTLLIFVLVGSTIASHSQEETIFGYKNTRRKVEESDDDGTDRHDKDPEDKDDALPDPFSSDEDEAMDGIEVDEDKSMASGSLGLVERIVIQEITV